MVERVEGGVGDDGVGVEGVLNGWHVWAISSLGMSGSLVIGF